MLIFSFAAAAVGKLVVHGPYVGPMMEHLSSPELSAGSDTAGSNNTDL